MSTQAKPWYKSKLVWFNAIVAAGAAAEASLHLIADYFDPRVYFGIIMTVSAINVILRFATSSSIGK
jgi:hypothetical protein